MAAGAVPGLSGKVALVTGAGAKGGNGHAIALALAWAGADLLVSDTDLAGVEQTVREVEALDRRCVHCLADNGRHEGSAVRTLFRTL